MDFIERFFGVSPDGGTGSLEAVLITLPLVIFGLVVAARSARRFRRRI